MLAVSSTLACTVGAYDACQTSSAEIRTRNVSFFRTFCHQRCVPLNNPGIDPTKAAMCGVSDRLPLPAARAQFHRLCSKYRSIDFASELPHMLRDTRKLPHAVYLSYAMSSRFCLIAPGDFESTHKITEAMALGGAGGCIPIFVIQARSRRKLDVQEDIATLLPYTRWLDYCETAYFVKASTAASNMSAVLARLDSISASEGQAKLAALRRVRNAFLFRSGSVQRPSAPHFIISEACAAARQWRASGSAVNREAFSTNVSRCTLG